MKPKKAKELCVGCHDDFYNRVEREGCWCYEKAEVVKRKAVHVDQRPPWKQKATWMMNCYHEPRWIYVDPKVTC